MGMDLGSLKFCLSALDMGHEVRSACTLGRLGMFATAKEIHDLLAEHGRCPADFWDRFPWREPVYGAEDVFRTLGFEAADTLDYSPYEGAEIVHDLNLPIPASLRGRYDMVIDGGTLEHVFNYPVGLANAMGMVREGGHLILYTPANNQCGHGFYQFSPELFFRALSPANGFELERIYLLYKKKYYHVVDPVAVHGRVELITGDGAMLLVHARKVADVVPFAAAPQQSDYVEAWAKSEESAPPAEGGLKAYLRGRLSDDQIKSISRVLNRWRRRQTVRRWYRNARISNRRFFVPVTDWKVTSARATAGAAT